jgi:DNA-binding response OmpR family regulator
MYGEELMKIANNVLSNRGLAESIYGKDFDKSSEFFDVK